MSMDLKATVKEVCGACNNDQHRMIDIVRGVQEGLGYVSGEAMEQIADGHW